MTESEPVPREVKVLKSARKADTYIYLPVDADYDDLPEALRSQFGDASTILEFHLSAERELAQADPRAVLDALERQGFYLQLPPSVEELRKRS